MHWWFCVLCNNIARMGLQNTTARCMRDASWSAAVFFVTTLQGWAYKTQQTRKMHCKDGLTKHNKHARCIDDSVFFVRTLQEWVYKHRTTRCMRAIRRFLCKILQGWVYKTQQTCEMHARCIMETTLARVHAPSCKCVPVVAKSLPLAHGGACEMRDASWSSAVFFVTTFQGWVYKHTTTRCMREIRRFLCDNIPRMGLRNTTNTRDAWMIVFSL